MSATVNEQPQYPTPQAIPPEAENASTSQAQQRNQQLAGKIERLGQYANGYDLLSSPFMSSVSANAL